MNRAIELHDSIVEAIERNVGYVGIQLDAYVHVSAGRPGIDAGTGWAQEIELVFRNADAEGEMRLPCDLSTGSLQTGQSIWENCIPLPIDLKGGVKLTLKGKWGGELVVKGPRVFSQEVNEPRYVEEFRP